MLTLIIYLWICKGLFVFGPVVRVILELEGKQMQSCGDLILSYIPICYCFNI